MSNAQGNEMKDESAPDFNTLGFEPGTQWSEHAEVEIWKLRSMAMKQIMTIIAVDPSDEMMIK